MAIRIVIKLNETIKIVLKTKTPSKNKKLTKYATEQPIIFPMATAKIAKVEYSKRRVLKIPPELSPTIFCVTSIVVCLFCISKAMTIIPVGFTYATYGALTITAVTLFGIFKYNQTPNIYGTIGLILIISGVILLNLFGKVK